MTIGNDEGRDSPMLGTIALATLILSIVRPSTLLSSPSNLPVLCASL